jgi:phosphoglycolate phosphatase-like HAD superfamily hydrolase
VKQDYTAVLAHYEPTHDFLVCIDSDGCAFDTMGIKQRECFCPWMIACFDLQPVAQAARECKEFADLFSTTRGANRHVTVKKILTELLPEHPLARARAFTPLQLPHYFRWVDDPSSLLSNEGLRRAAEAACGEAQDELTRVLSWSERVNWAVGEIVRGIPPFPFVRESLESIADKADVVVVSATPIEALQREWKEHGLAQHTSRIWGQEAGTKREQIAALLDHHDANHIIMIGDAPGDLRAAHENGVLFYPIIPGCETESWKGFFESVAERFFALNYTTDYEQQLIATFLGALPDTPPWEVAR